MVTLHVIMFTVLKNAKLNPTLIPQAAVFINLSDDISFTNSKLVCV